MEDILIQAKLLTQMNITELEYQRCLIKNQDNIFRLVDRLNELEQLYHSVVLRNQQLEEENKDLKKQKRSLEMDNNLLFFELQCHNPNAVSSDVPDLSISE
jgi:hypothetical protein